MSDNWFEKNCSTTGVSKFVEDDIDLSEPIMFHIVLGFGFVAFLLFLLYLVIKTI